MPDSRRRPAPSPHSIVFDSGLARVEHTSKVIPAEGLTLKLDGEAEVRELIALLFSLLDRHKRARQVDALVSARRNGNNTGY